MQIGDRIFYDQDGEIIYATGEVSGDALPRKEITDVQFVDLNYGAIDTTKYRIVGINPDTKQPILEEIEIPLTPEQQRIKELEDQLLLMADAESGGVL